MNVKELNIVFDLDDTMYDLMEPFKKAHEKLFAAKVFTDSRELFLKSRIYSDIAVELEKAGKIQKEDALKLQRWFREERIFVSEEIGCQKPDVRTFQSVAGQMQIRPENTWYVGDTYELDIAGAARAGWHTIWLNHRKRKCPVETSEAEDELRDGKDLLPLLRKKYEEVMVSHIST